MKDPAWFMSSKDLQYLRAASARAFVSYVGDLGLALYLGDRFRRFPQAARKRRVRAKWINSYRPEPSVAAPWSEIKTIIEEK